MNSNINPIYVTRPYLPPFREFVKEAARIWESNILTNNGPLHQELELKLADYLDVPYVVLFNNGTIALQTAIQCMRLSGEVITTPYSFVATAHSILWNDLRPVFVDIEPNTCNIDPKRIVEAISPETTAIVAVHTYGFPCDVDAIREIADAYNLKVIYDAAHAFGVRRDNKSILLNGDLSVLSLHATKVFNTFEGGAVVCKDESVRNRLNFIKNFGFLDETRIAAVGTNGKMSEISAAMGICQLRHIDDLIGRRRVVHEMYTSYLSSSTSLELLNPASGDCHNYSYYPVLVRSPDLTRDDVYFKLKDLGIYTRRYFFPLISDLPMYSSYNRVGDLNIASDIASSVLCLPIYPDLSVNDSVRIVESLLVVLGEKSA
jgi:dTDP-4-amino-4,6-dideoxygalactose transaminase